MQQVIVSTVEPQVEDHARASRLVRAPVLETSGRRMIADELAMGPDRVRIGDDGRQWDAIAVVGQDSKDGPRRVEFDRSNARARHQLDPKLAGQAYQGLGDRTRPAARIPDTFPGLHVGDAAEHGGRQVGR